MESLRNPFWFGGDIGAEGLVDRDTETAQVERTIRDGNKLFLIGPRRFGKSSILRAASERLAAKGAIVIRVDADPISSLNELVENIVALSASHLRGKVHRVIDDLGKFFSRLRPEAKFDINEREWNVTLGVRTDDEGARGIQNLVDALNGLEKLALAQPVSKQVGLVIDEFQRVVELGGQRAEAQLRSAIQQHSRVGYVFAGSNTRLLTAMTMNHDRPFYRLGTVMTVGAVPRQDFAAFITKSLRKSGFRVADPTVVDSLLSLAEDVPYNVQSLANSCWNELLSTRGAGQPTLTADVLQKSLIRAVMELDPIYTGTWTKLTSIQQNALRAVIREKGKGMSSAPVVRTIGAASSTVHRALEALRNQNILRDEPGDGKIQLRFDDPFFAHWIRMRAMNLKIAGSL
jgi:energy-coupling factor transporter ATP-binding protein EcfA2